MKEDETFRVERFTTQAGDMELTMPNEDDEDGEYEVQEEQ